MNSIRWRRPAVCASCCRGRGSGGTRAGARARRRPRGWWARARRRRRAGARRRRARARAHSRGGRCASPQPSLSSFWPSLPPARARRCRRRRQLLRRVATSRRPLRCTRGVCEWGPLQVGHSKIIFSILIKIISLRFDDTYIYLYRITWE